MPTDDPDNPFEQIEAGEAGMRGIEFGGQAMVGPLQATVAYTYLDSKITKATTARRATVMRTAAERRVDLVRPSLRWRRGRCLSLGAGLRCWTSYWGDNENTVRNASMTLVDLSAGYDFGALRSEWVGIELDLNVSNVANRRIVSCAAWGCDFGQARVKSTTISYAW